MRVLLVGLFLSNKLIQQQQSLIPILKENLPLGKQMQQEK